MINITWFILFVLWIIGGILTLSTCKKNKENEDFKYLKLQYILCWVALIANLFVNIFR